MLQCKNVFSRITMTTRQKVPVLLIHIQSTKLKQRTKKMFHTYTTSYTTYVKIAWGTKKLLYTCNLCSTQNFNNKSSYWHWIYYFTFV